MRSRKNFNLRWVWEGGGRAGGVQSLTFGPSGHNSAVIERILNEICWSASDLATMARERIIYRSDSDGAFLGRGVGGGGERDNLGETNEKNVLQIEDSFHEK